MSIRRLLICCAFVMAAHLAHAARASAQGCILLRQTSPMFGTTGSLTQEVGTWDVTFTARNSTADMHYNGTVRQLQRESEAYICREPTELADDDDQLSAHAARQLAHRHSVRRSLVGHSIAEIGRSGRARKRKRTRPRRCDHPGARLAVGPSDAQRSWNLQIGGGVKLPTGDNDATDVFPDNNGNNNLERYVDISVHPGDGGWGIIFDLQGYKAMGRFVTFGSGTWLANPRNTGTASRGNLVTNATPTNVNTVSDQFVFRAGTSVSITPRIAASLAWRMEGVPRYDLMGRSDGFRRPGVEMYWEPGVTLTAGRHSVSLNVPVGYYFNRFRNPYTGNPGDSTFPEVVAIATYSVRLGRPQMVDHGPTDQPPPGLTPIRPQTDDQQQDQAQAQDQGQE